VSVFCAETSCWSTVLIQPSFPCDDCSMLRARTPIAAPPPLPTVTVKQPPGPASTADAPQPTLSGHLSSKPPIVPPPRLKPVQPSPQLSAAVADQPPSPLQPPQQPTPNGRVPKRPKSPSSPTKIEKSLTIPTDMLKPFLSACCVLRFDCCVLF
jgi:hypothetical protein